MTKISSLEAERRYAAAGHHISCQPARPAPSAPAAAPSLPSSLPPADGAADTLCPQSSPSPCAGKAPATPDSNGMRPGVVWGLLQAAYMAEAIAYETDFPLSQSGLADNWKE